MPRIPFDALPDHGRLWVFPIGRDLDEQEEAACLSVVDAFLDGWAAHGVPLRSGRALVERRFLLVGVDVDAESPSGCSIDALVRHLRETGRELETTLVDHAPVWFRDGDAIRTVSRAEFKGLAAAGAVTSETHVFDTSLTEVGQARRGELERPAHGTWHGRAYFGVAAPA